jgi:hypothetical protein
MGVAEHQDLRRRVAQGERLELVRELLRARTYSCGSSSDPCATRTGPVAAVAGSSSSTARAAGAQSLGGPGQALARERDAGVRCEPAQGDEVVVAGDADPGQRRDALHARVRRRAVAHEVPGADVGVHALGGQAPEHRLQGVEVGVDVREDPEAHRKPTVAHGPAALDRS